MKKMNNIEKRARTRETANTVMAWKVFVSEQNKKEKTAWQEKKIEKSCLQK